MEMIAASGTSLEQPAARLVLETLRARIVSGELAAGTRIVERRLCSELGISRTPLREALKLLEREGLVELLQNRGARVKPFRADEVRELFEVLANLEGMAAGLAAKHVEPAGLSRIHAIHELVRAAISTQDRELYFQLNHDFHHAIVAAAGNQVLRATHATLMAQALRGRYLISHRFDRLHDAFAEHERVLQALERRDAETASHVWRAHALKSGAAVMRALSHQA